MSVKKSIGWAEATCNPIHGCTEGCPYCYARRMAQRLAGRCGYPKKNPFKPSFSPEQLKKLDRKKPTRFFICSMGDMFDGEAKISWGEKVFTAIKKNPQHEYFILTKQPQHLKWYRQCFKGIGNNVWIGVTVTGKLMHDGTSPWPSLSDKWRIDYLQDYWHGKRFISFEPLLADVGKLNLDGISWIIIGGLSGTKPFKPPKEWVDNIKHQAKAAGIQVYLKANLK